MIKTLLYGFITMVFRPPQYGKLRTTRHRMLLRVFGSHHKKKTYDATSYQDVLEKTEGDRIGATVDTRRLLWSSRVACTQRTTTATCQAGKVGWWDQDASR